VSVDTSEHQSVPLLGLEAISHRYGERQVLKEISLSVDRGEIVGLLGPNGSGKSTLLAVIGGLVSQEEGVLRLDGEVTSPGSGALRQILGFVFQAPSLDARLTARENLTLSGRLRGLGGSELKQRVEEGLSRAGLSGRASEAVSTFSGGMKRRLDIARALLGRPSLLVADEPTAGLDEGSFQATWEQIETLRSERSTAVLVSTHRPEEAARCDRLLFLDGGEVVAEGTPGELVASLREDVVVVETAEADRIADLLVEDLGMEVRRVGEDLHVPCSRGHEAIVRVVEAAPEGSIRAVHLRRPGLGDVFLHLTGRSLADESSEEAP
jgi:ABC-2 type transport system ATP-binding protein